jgi:predicted MFS family arabinose efflux permease
MPAFAGDVLGVGADGLGWLLTIVGVGAIGGALVTANIRAGLRGRWLIAGNLLGPVFLVLFSLSRSLALSLVLVFLVGAGNAIRNTLASSLLQLNTREQYHGRVMSVYNLLFNGMSRVGALAIGGLAQGIGVSWAIGSGALVTVVWGLFALWGMPQLVRAR